MRRFGFGLDARFDLLLGRSDSRQALFAPGQLFRNAQALGQVTRIGRLRPFEQRRHLRLELGLPLLGVAVTHRLVARSIGVHLGAIQADGSQLQHPHHLGIAQHLDKDRFDLLQKPPAETVDRVVIRMIVGGDVAHRDRVVTRSFQGAAGEGARGIAIQQQRHQHRRVVRIATPTGVALLEFRPVQLFDDVHNEAGQMIVGQPLLHARRKQVLRFAIDRNKPRH